MNILLLHLRLNLMVSLLEMRVTFRLYLDKSLIERAHVVFVGMASPETLPPSATSPCGRTGQRLSRRWGQVRYFFKLCFDRLAFGPTLGTFLRATERRR